MIVATAGHIDHGKTSLVKALTGVDTDRLPEEKKRGLSIDLGFAYPKDSAALGFVDVPGHERFVRNMIAGVTAIDCALLVIAADDGPMPQTREHLAILDLLGVAKGVVALTKIDRASAERVAEARAEIAGLVAGTRLAAAPVIAVSSVTGEGIAELRAWLQNAARETVGSRGSGGFRMAIDRAFVIGGAGVVVTGAVSSGVISIDDRLVLAPRGIEVRVRGIHAQNAKAQQGRAGERCAINIAAPRLSVEQVQRGDWLIAPDLHAPTQRFDVRVRVLASETRALRHWSPAHVHLGAADVPARVAILEAPSLAPGEEGLAQIVLQQPVSAFFGERFIIRDQSGQRTIGGGMVIDPFAPARGRARPQRLSLLRELETLDAAKALRGALAHAPNGFNYGEFLCARNIAAPLPEVQTAARGLRIAGEGRGSIAFTAERWSAMAVEIHKALAPDGQGLSEAALRKASGLRVPPPAVSAMLQELTAKGEIAHANGLYRPRGASLALDAKDAALWAKLEKLLGDESLRPPSISEMAVALKSDQRAVERLLQKIARMGLATQISPNRYYKPDYLRRLGEIAQAVSRETPGGLVSIRAFRDKSDIGRNLSVEVLEYFDRLGFTARAGEHRRICKAIADVKWVRSGG